MIQHPRFGEFQILCEISRGTYSTVYQCTHCDLASTVAIKVIDEDANEEWSNIENFFNIEKQLSHPLLCESYDHFIWENKHCLIYEFVDGVTLLDYANEQGPLNEFEIQTILGQIVSALYYLHENCHVIHRDLKCENILIDKNRTVRIIDFGFSCSGKEKIHSTICGSPAYIAPEMICNSNYNYPVDVWSLGVVLYAISYGFLPFYDPNINTSMEKIVNEQPEFPNTVSFLLRDLISKMLEKDPAKRITLKGIMEHKFFTRGNFGQNFKFDVNAFERVSSELGPYASKFLTRNMSESELKLIEDKSDTKEYMFYRIMFKQYIINRFGSYGRVFLQPVQLYCATIERNSFPIILKRKRRQTTDSVNQTWCELPALDKDCISCQNSSNNAICNSVLNNEAPPSYLTLRKPRLLKSKINP